MIIGVLREIDDENRVALLPEALPTLIELENYVLVEENAGLRAFYSDEDYEQSGGTIDDKADLIRQSDVLLKVGLPTIEEILLMKAGQILVSELNPQMNPELVSLLLEQKVTAFALDMVPRTTRAQVMDIRSSMATVAGYKAVLAAAYQLPTFFPMFMSAAGTIRPAKVLILGAGVAGLQAISVARKLGAVVEAFDVRKAAREEVLSLGAKFVDVEGAAEDDQAGGYAIEQTEQYKALQAQTIHDHAVKSNVVICTAQIPGRQAPVLLKAETVEAMQAGSVVVDLAASTGGNCELTMDDRTLVHNGVMIIGESNFASKMPVDASRMFGKNLINFLKLIIDEEGFLKLDFGDDIVAGMCVTHSGVVVNERLKEMRVQKSPAG